MTPTTSNAEAQSNEGRATVRAIDLFCGIGGFRIAAQRAGARLGIDVSCVFSSDIDPDAQETYEANFGERPAGDITKIPSSDIPDHDLLMAGFPCQAFSIIGDRKGFEDTRGTLFFEIARILEAKRPRSFILENVKQLTTHERGNTFSRIMETISRLGYYAGYRVLNALDFGLPQKRERVIIVGFDRFANFSWPSPVAKTVTLDDILDDEVSDFYYVSNRIRESRARKVAAKAVPEGRTIWHENKSGNISPLKYSCALRAGASYNYLLVDGVRRPTERELLRLQGFPESFRITGSYSTVRKQAGNAVPVPMIEAVITEQLIAMYGMQSSSQRAHPSGQLALTY